MSSVAVSGIDCMAGGAAKVVCYRVGLERVGEKTLGKCLDGE